MEITTDVLLKGPDWNRAINELSTIFKKQSIYSIYLLAMALGIMYDERIDDIEVPDDWAENPRNVPRNVMQNSNQENGRLDFMFQTAILTSQKIEMSEEERLDLAFGDNKSGFNKIAFLTSFANYGVLKLLEYVGDTPLETIDKLKDFLNSSIEGTNFEIDDISDDYIIDQINTE